MIQPGLDNQLISSFLLLLDYRILSRGQAYTNYSSLFYPITSYDQNLNIYSCPFKSLVNDIGISGANVLSGVYLNGNYVTIGQSGLQAINHYNGCLYFNQQLPNNTIISGNYAIKDFSIKISDQPEYKLLFETKYTTNGAYLQNPTGISLDSETSPIIYLRTKHDDNVPFALGGYEDKTKILRAIVIADTEYQRMAVVNILKDMCYSPFYITTQVPFDAFGSYTGIPYSYTGLPQNNNYFPWIFDVKVTDIPRYRQFKSTPANMSMCDFQIKTIAKHTYQA